MRFHGRDSSHALAASSCLSSTTSFSVGTCNIFGSIRERTCSYFPLVGVLVCSQTPYSVVSCLVCRDACVHVCTCDLLLFLFALSRRLCLWMCPCMFFMCVWVYVWKEYKICFYMCAFLFQYLTRSRGEICKPCCCLDGDGGLADKCLCMFCYPVVLARRYKEKRRAQARSMMSDREATWAGMHIAWGLCSPWATTKGDVYTDIIGDRGMVVVYLCVLQPEMQRRSRSGRALFHVKGMPKMQ